jgi:hypothetical protein
MKNKFTFLSAILILLTLILGCNFYDPTNGSSDSSKSGNPKTSESSNGSNNSTDAFGKVGVPECDQVIDFFTEQANSPDDNFVTKAARDYFFNTIREKLKQSIEANKGDKVKMASDCRRFKDQLDKFKTEENNKNK